MANELLVPAFQIEINGTRLGTVEAGHVIDLTVEGGPGAIDQLTITLANPYPDMPWTHGDFATVFQEGSAIRVSMGYVDDVHPMFDGEITTLSPVYPEDDGPTLQVTARTRLHRLSAGTKVRTFVDMADSDIASQIGGEAGLSVQADASSTVHPYMVQSGETDLDFLRRRAASLRYELFVDGRTMHFRRERNDETRAVTLVWGLSRESFRPGSTSFPLKSFQPVMELQGQVTEVVVRGQDPLTRQPVEGRATQGDIVSMGGATSGPQAAEQAFGARSELVIVTEPFSSQDEASQRAQALFNERALSFVTGSGSALGVPQLKAGKVVELSGLGTRFDGRYYVTRVSHTIDAGGYRTHFQVRKNAVS